jgi:cysteinyl-tRNA synthetase
MELKLHNTLTRTKDTFRPIDPKNVRMYACGPTVYDFVHIGNGRMAIVFDVLFRLLRHVYGADHVTYVRNITDVDDKINARAAESGIDIRELTETTARQYQEDVAALGCLPPTHEPRATENIPEMIAMIEALIAAGHAYVAEGHVLYAVASKPDYGKLSRRSLDDMIAGARVEVAPYKRDPMDFVLWKPSKPGEPAWPSPWGEGRPGWHIECSAMSEKLLGETFDIHGGGIDLVFPHHENEIAQSEGAHHGHALAQFWLHNGFLQVEGEKMSKSLGNFVTIRDLTTTDRFGGFRWPGAVVRFAMLTTHYRQPIDFSERALEQASIALDLFATFGRWDEVAEPTTTFVDALCDDLNTPGAIVDLHRLLKVAQGRAREIAAQMAEPGAMLSDSTYEAAHQLAAGLAWLGIDVRSYDRRWFEKQANEKLSTAARDKIDQQITARVAARKAKDFAEADRIRAELEAMGIAVKDSRDPKTGELTTTWEVKR